MATKSLRVINWTPEMDKILIDYTGKICDKDIGKAIAIEGKRKQPLSSNALLKRRKDLGIYKNEKSD